MVTIMKRDKVGAALSTDAEIWALTSAQRDKHWIICKHRYLIRFTRALRLSGWKNDLMNGSKDARGKRLRRLRIAKGPKFGIDLADIVAVKFAG
jgi:hypothetical protein